MSTEPKSPAYRLELRKISKEFPGCRANDGIDLKLAPGEIHALLGENGAGKSTLVKIVYGVLAPDSGAILWQGEPVRVTSPAHARRLGIGMVFQHFSLFDSLTVAENIILGFDGAPSLSDLEARITEIGKRYGLALDPARPVHSLSVGERQRVEIVRCLLQEPRLLIMDEPTSVLTPNEATQLFETLRRLASDGCTILYISHKLDEIRALCDWATILRGGKVVGACDPRHETARALAEMMVGGAIVEPKRVARATVGAPRLVIERLSTRGGDLLETEIREASLTVHAGEIVGIAGVAGNGQAALLSALSGESRGKSEGILLDGKPVGDLGPRERRALGLGVVPEERLGRGAVPDMSLADNTLLPAVDRPAFAARGLIHRAAIADFARAIIQRFKVATAGETALARGLSGGNLQKFIVGRELMAEPGVLVIAAPTWGVDAGAAAWIHQAILDAAERGAAILVISQDLDELFQITDRMAALCDGKLSPALPTAETSVERIGLMMGGRFDEAAAQAKAPIYVA